MQNVTQGYLSPWVTERFPKPSDIRGVTLRSGDLQVQPHDQDRRRGVAESDTLASGAKKTAYKAKMVRRVQSIVKCAVNRHYCKVVWALSEYRKATVHLTLMIFGWPWQRWRRYLEQLPQGAVPTRRHAMGVEMGVGRRWVWVRVLQQNPQTSLALANINSVHRKVMKSIHNETISLSFYYSISDSSRTQGNHLIVWSRFVFVQHCNSRNNAFFPRDMCVWAI